MWSVDLITQEKYSNKLIRMGYKYIENIDKYKKIVDEMMLKVYSLHHATFEEPNLFNIWDHSENNDDDSFIRYYIHKYRLLYILTNEMYEYIRNPKNKYNFEYNYKIIKLLKINSRKLYKLLNGNKKKKTAIEKQGINKYYLLFCAKKI